MTAPIARILLRYLSAALVAKGIFGSELGDELTRDPEVVALIETAIGLAIGAATEVWYWAARKFGWAK